MIRIYPISNNDIEWNNMEMIVGMGHNNKGTCSTVTYRHNESEYVVGVSYIFEKKIGFEQQWSIQNEYHFFIFNVGFFVNCKFFG